MMRSQEVSNQADDVGRSPTPKTLFETDSLVPPPPPHHQAGESTHFPVRDPQRRRWKRPPESRLWVVGRVPLWRWSDFPISRLSDVSIVLGSFRDCVLDMFRLFALEWFYSWILWIMRSHFVSFLWMLCAIFNCIDYRLKLLYFNI